MKHLALLTLLTITGANSALAGKGTSQFVASCGLQNQQAEVSRLLAQFSNGVAENIIGYTLKELDGEVSPEICLFALRANAERLSRMVISAAGSTSAATSIRPLKPAVIKPSVSSNTSIAVAGADQKVQTDNHFEQAFASIKVDVEGIEASFSGDASRDVQSIELNRQRVLIRADGSWSHRVYLPENGLNISIDMVDREGSINSREFYIERGQFSSISGVEPIQPKLRDRQLGANRVAVIIGVDRYRSLPSASYAEADALSAYKMFTQTLNIPSANVKDLIGANANEVNIKLAFRQWLASRVDPGNTELYIFYAGHGLTDDLGEKRYWMPYDGHSQLLDDTAIAFSDVMETVGHFKPAKTFVVADSCYSGASRSEQALTAQRPIRVVKKLNALPDNTYLFAATQPDQTALPYTEAQHGLFSYWWLKGLEGGADLNSDKQISAGELDQFTRENVARQSGGSQVPDFNGNPNTVVLAWD